MIGGDGIEFVDLAPAIDAIDRAYLDPGARGQFEARVHVVAWCAADARLYVVVADAFVFWTDDDGMHWHEVSEVNRQTGGELHPPGAQQIDMVVDTPARTVLLVARDRHDGTERGVVWRKPQGADTFVRAPSTDPAWATSKGGNATAGYMGSPPRSMVAVSVYASPAHFWYSLDDGLSWRRHDLGGEFADHAHEVYLHRSANLQRCARLWVSGGDDPTGRRSGVVTFDAIAADGTLGGMYYALRERPGYRLVGLAGDGKYVYIGNESLAGGMLRILDNAQSIGLADFEYVLGKGRHDYHQFRSMVATADGLLAAASDSYAFVSDSIRADSGGYLYLSSDGGASFRELSLGVKWVNSLVYDGRSFWVAGGMNREDGPDASALAMTLLRVPKPAPFHSLSGEYCAKAVIVDSSAFYAMARYADYPRPSLVPGERTFRVDLSPFSSIVFDAETVGPATLVVEALPFQNWDPEADAWRDVTTLTSKGGRVTVELPSIASHNRWFRVRNAGDAVAEVRHLAFVGRR